MKTIDTVLAAFENYCRTGDATLPEAERAYLRHAVTKAAYESKDGILSHPLFTLMALHADPTKIAPFINHVTEPTHVR